MEVPPSRSEPLATCCDARRCANERSDFTAYRAVAISAVSATRRKEPLTDAHPPGYNAFNYMLHGTIVVSYSIDASAC